MKALKRLLLVALVILFSSMVYSQPTYKVKKSAYPQWSLSPIAGVSFPVGALGNSYKSGANLGLDLSYKVNKEVGFYGEFGYNFLRNNTEGIPDAKYLAYTVGPRYFFTSKNLKSSIFLEAGIGAYTFSQEAYTVGELTSPGSTDTKFGVNAGIGAILNLGRDVDLLFKTKYNTVLNTDGSSSFITPVLGVDVRF
jgi:hypothetical protein